MIVVTGATGELGRRIVRALARRLGPQAVVASARDPSKAQDLAALGVAVRHGDYDDPASLAGAFAGASQVLLMSSNAGARGGDPRGQHRAAIAAAKAAGVGRIVYTSQAAAGAGSLFPPMRDHAATEAMLRESGLAWTALRHGFYAASAPMFLRDAPRTGLLEAPGDGPVAWTAHDDLAEAAAAVLAEEGRFEGPTPPLTGAEAVDLAGVCRLAAEAVGRPVERRVIPDDGARAAMPPAAAPMMMGFFEAARAGEWARVDPTLARLIGRAPTPLRDVLRAALA